MSMSMNKFKLFNLFFCMGVVAFNANAASLDPKVPYPAAEPGQARQVIHLPAVPMEENLKVQLMVGKTLKVDCNQHAFGGEIKEHTLEGWGYPYYSIKALNGPMATLMACPDQEPTEKFVQLRGNDFLLDYNSRLPIVVYTPADVEVKYRIWQAGYKVEEAVKE